MSIDSGFIDDMLRICNLDNDSGSAATYEVLGYVDHDNKRYDNAEENFEKSYGIINKWRKNKVSDDQVKLAAKSKINLLKAYDEIVEGPMPLGEKGIKDAREKLLPYALEECLNFEIGKAYGENRVEFYIHHAIWVRNKYGLSSFPIIDVAANNWLIPLRKSEISLAKDLTKSAGVGDLLYNIYFNCVVLHDKRRLFDQESHSSESIMLMQENYKSYLMLLLSNM